jgi:hypothetical protein
MRTSASNARTLSAFSAADNGRVLTTAPVAEAALREIKVRRFMVVCSNHAEELPRITSMNANSRGDSGKILVSIVSNHPVWND